MMEEAHANIQSRLKSMLGQVESPKTTQLTLLSNELDNLRNDLKSLLRDLKTLKTCRVDIRQQLEVRKGAIRGTKSDQDTIAEEKLAVQELILSMAEIERIQNVAIDDTQELNEGTRDLVQMVWEIKQEKKDRMQEVLIELTDALKRDSSNMKMIAILTAFFLPFTFMAILLTTPMFKWPDPENGKVILWLPFRIYWIASGLMTLILGCWGILLFRPKWLFERKG
ncbi:hypothetical protein OIDMADRAFT_17899 [Oidiodendron maius Zn]|uniref:Uncharacterized protein n=1 Tax=Oidiodendron maius (strain Zn) TaxID=913774 RepID=A0A0C3HT66_OIDMZ|nr:hypothetical protein OIDMADRAFT_17899 [Oidiodendron maius Zn]